MASFACLVQTAMADRLPQVSAGSFHICAIRSDSSVVCWGDNSRGGLDVPADAGPIARVSAGNSRSCAIDVAGRPLCWGDQTDGEFLVPGDLGRVSHLDADTTATCAIRVAGAVTCWGYVGTGSYGSHGITTEIPLNLGVAKSVSVGETHACAVKLEGTVACWGSDDNGQSTVPSDLGRVTTVAAGGYNTRADVMRGHSCAIKVSGQIVCWGSNAEGQIAIPADLGPVEQVGAGLAHTCVVKVDRTVVCWGMNQFGQATVPPDLGRVAQLSVGPFTSCVVRENGTVACWGNNLAGQVTVPTASFPSLSGATVDFGDSLGLDFGDVLAGSRSSVLRSVVSSTPRAAGVPLTIKSAALGSDGAGAFSVASPGCVPGRLADGASCSIGVRFTPRIWQRGVISGSLTVTDDSEAASHTIPLTGTAVEPKSFILQGVSATPGTGNVRFAWQSSDDSKLTITVAQPVTSTVTRIVRGKKTTRKVTTIKPVQVLGGFLASAGDSGWTWNRKIGATAAAKGTWAYSVTARSARGTLTRSGTITLN